MRSSIAAATSWWRSTRRRSPDVAGWRSASPAWPASATTPATSRSTHPTATASSLLTENNCAVHRVAERVPRRLRDGARPPAPGDGARRRGHPRRPHDGRRRGVLLPDPQALSRVVARRRRPPHPHSGRSPGPRLGPPAHRRHRERRARRGARPCRERRPPRHRDRRRRGGLLRPVRQPAHGVFACSRAVIV